MRMFSVLVWFFFICLLSSSWCQKKTKEELDPATVKVLSGILDSLDSFTNHRLRDLEKIRLTKGNSTTKIIPKEDSMTFEGVERKSNISNSIKALKDGIMGRRPMKKTFGYKVTVYTSPIEEGGKDGKPVLVTQYVGGDMMPSKPDAISSRAGDLDESANHPQEDVIKTSGSIPYAVHDSNVAGAEHVANAEKSANSGELQHNRKTEHQAASEKGHQKSLSEKSVIEKGHDRQSHREKAGEHHKETDKEAHRHDTHAHDRGGATQQGIRERTEIEYYEREHFLDTEYDQAKDGHSKTSGLKEHIEHSDKDVHDRKREHSIHDTKAFEQEEAAKSGTTKKHGVEEHGLQDYDPAPHEYTLRPNHYSPPYGAHHHIDAAAVADAKSHKVKDHGSYGEKNKEEVSGHKEHKDVKDHHSEHGDHGHSEKDKGRRKEGYRERGYKITAEREYFLNDAHHDTGHGSHTSGEKVRDREGVRHGSKEGEKDKGFVKEQKSHDSHDAAYDAKERKFYDGDAHKEGYAKSSLAASEAGSEQAKHHKEIPDVHSGDIYMEDLPHPQIRKTPIPLYPHPIPYEAAGNKGHEVIAPTPKPTIVYGKPRRQVQRFNNKPTTSFSVENSGESDVKDKSNGYVGYASYKKKPNPLIASIRDSVQKQVKAPPPSYVKTTSPPKISDSSEEKNDVQFPTTSSKELYDKRAEIRQYGTHLGTQSPPHEKYDDTIKHVNSKYHSSEENENLYDPEYSEKYSEEKLKTYPRESDHKRYRSKPPIRYHYRRPKPVDIDDVYGVNSKDYGDVDATQTRYQDYNPQGKPQVSLNHYQDPQYHSHYPPNYGSPYQQKIHPELVEIGEAALRVLLPKKGNVYVRQQPSRTNQNKPPYSPVVLLSPGPPNNNPTVDVWYTRQPPN